MTERLKIGGGALLDGVMIRSERFSAVVRCIEGDDPHYELTEEKTQELPGWLGVIARTPLLRGVCLPLLLAWQLKGRTLEGTKKPEPPLSMKIVALIMLAMVFVPFIWIANSFFPPGLVRNFVALAPFFLLFGGGIIWMRKSVSGILKYHGAEHKAVWVYDDTGNPPDIETARKRSRFHPRCGSCLIASWFILLVVLSLAFPNLPMLWVLLIIGAVSAELTVIARYGFLGKVLNCAGLALQRLTTIEPDDEHLRIAIASTKAVLALETTQNLPELPRTRTFKDFSELEEVIG